jgi:hypothetical protein
MEDMIESVESTEVLDSGAESTESDGVEKQESKDDGEFGSKSSKEYISWLKAMRDASPDNAKWARLSKDNHGRLFQLNQLEPKGIDGIREKYAMLDSIQHGEMKGFEALTAMQDEIKGMAEVDTLLAAGDPKALEALGDDFNEGLAKLTPTILDRIKESDPAAYASAVLPHFVDALRGSELVGSFNGLVDVLEEKPPSWLPDDKKEAWIADKMNRITDLASKMGGWFNNQEKRAADLKNGNAPRGTMGKDGQKAPTVEDERTKFDRDVQDHHWKTNISPKLDQHADSKFNELFKHNQKRLNLPTAALASFKQDVVREITKKAAANKDYMAGINRYRSQKNPDAATVLNFAKVEFDKHAKSVVDSMTSQRYGSFLRGKSNGAPTPKPSAASNGAKPGPVAPGVQIVTVRPPDNQINHKGRTLAQIHDKIFPLKNGKVVQVRQ